MFTNLLKRKALHELFHYNKPKNAIRDFLKTLPLPKNRYSPPARTVATVKPL